MASRKTRSTRRLALKVRELGSINPSLTGEYPYRPFALAAVLNAGRKVNFFCVFRCR